MGSNPDADKEFDRIVGEDMPGKISKATRTMMTLQFSQKDDTGHDKDFLGLVSTLQGVLNGLQDTLHEPMQEGDPTIALITDPIVRAQAIKARWIDRIGEHTVDPILLAQTTEARCKGWIAMDQLQQPHETLGSSGTKTAALDDAEDHRENMAVDCTDYRQPKASIQDHDAVTKFLRGQGQLINTGASIVSNMLRTFAANTSRVPKVKGSIIPRNITAQPQPGADGGRMRLLGSSRRTQVCSWLNHKCTRRRVWSKMLRGEGAAVAAGRATINRRQYSTQSAQGHVPSDTRFHATRSTYGHTSCHYS